MTEKEQHILDAATHVFLRYGIQRSSLVDIAGEAGISRQTLYKTYANKDEIVRALMRRHHARMMARIEEGLASATAFGDQLDVVFRAIIVAPFEALSLSPHAAEIVEGLGAVSEEEIAAEVAAIRAVFAGLLAPHTASLKSRGLSVPDLAALTQTASRAIKKAATNRQDLDGQIACLKALLISAVAR